MTPHQEAILATGRATLRSEAEALNAIEATLSDEFIEAVETILACRGKLIVSGLGKSGHVARKITATLTSTGTPALFLHSAEAAHGDVGIIGKDDMILALSFSGETTEVINIVRYAKRNGNKIIAMTGKPNSTLATEADIHLDTSVSQEDCVINIVPTCSSTAQLAMGDALATALMEIRGFTVNNFAHFHPGGNIGKRIVSPDNQ